MADRNDNDLHDVPLKKDDFSNLLNQNGKGEFKLMKFGLATANDAAPAGTIISNIYEPEDEYQNLYIGASRDQGLIQPPYYLRTLDRLSQENNSLAPCIEAMVTNVDGTGYTFENQDKKADEAEDEEDDENIDTLEDFFREPWPGMSFRTMRKLIRRDLERVGNAYFEVLRNPQDEIVFIRHVDAKMMRIVRLDDPVPVKKTVIRNGKPVTITVMQRERRFTQDVNGITLVYFKEFGASRDINKNTGLWLAAGSRLPANLRGSEIIHFINVPDAHTPYGIPRWVNQLPSILGSRRAEEFNLEFFEHGGIPPVLILLQGGALGTETKKALQEKTSGSASHKNRIQVIEVEPNGGTWEQQSLTRVTVERFGSERQNDSMFEKYDERCELRVRRSFRLPPIFVGAAQDYTFASAYASYTVAEAQVFKPEREEFDEIISMLLLPAMGFAGYALKSNPLTIEDSTLKLQGIQIAIQTNVVNDAELLTELNLATGTNMKADDALVKLKTNAAMGLNPDGSKPPVQIPGVQGVPTSALNTNPSVSRDEGNPRSPRGLTGPAKVGGPIQKPPNTTSSKGPNKPSGKGATPVKPGNGQANGSTKVKKSDEEITYIAFRAVEALSKRDFESLTQVISEIELLDTADRLAVRDAAQTLQTLQKGSISLVDHSGCAHTLKFEDSAQLASNERREAILTRLIKGKGASFPVLNGGSGMRPSPIDQETLPGPIDTDDTAATTTNNAISHSATSDDHNAKSYGKFIAAMAPSSKR